MIPEVQYENEDASLRNSASPNPLTLIILKIWPWRQLAPEIGAALEEQMLLRSENGGSDLLVSLKWLTQTISWLTAMVASGFISPGAGAGAWCQITQCGICYELCHRVHFDSPGASPMQLLLWRSTVYTPFEWVAERPPFYFQLIPNIKFLSVKPIAPASLASRRSGSARRVVL